MGPAPGYSDDDGECNPWDAFAAAMQLMREKPDASEAEIAEAVTTCSVGGFGGGGAEPEQMQAAVAQQVWQLLIIRASTVERSDGTAGAGTTCRVLGEHGGALLQMQAMFDHGVRDNLLRHRFTSLGIQGL